MSYHRDLPKPKRHVPTFESREARELAIMAAIAKGLNGQESAQRIALRLGYRPSRRGIWPVSSSLRSMQKRELVGRLDPLDMWDHASYFLMPKGRELLKESSNG